MSRTFNAFEKATIKNTAREVARLAAKQEKLREQIKLYAEKIESEIKEIDETIVQYEDNVQKITGGYSASELCEKVSRGSQNDWVFKYPNTIVPAVEQNEHLYEEEVTLKDPDCKVAEEKEEKKEEEKEIQVEQPENFEDPFGQPENPVAEFDAFKEDEF